MPGGQGSSPICLLARRPCAVGSIACDRLTRASAGLFGLGRLRRVSYALSGATFFGRITQFVVPKVTSPRPCLRFDVMRSRPPCLRESIAQRKALRAATRLSARPVRPPFARHAGIGSCRSHASSPGNIGRAASLEVFRPLQRSLAALALSGAASLRTIPLRRFHPHVSPRVLNATCRRDGFSFALAVFRSSGFVAMKLAWRTCVVRAFQSNPSLAQREWTQWVPFTRPCRRVDDLLL